MSRHFERSFTTDLLQLAAGGLTGVDGGPITVVIVFNADDVGNDQALLRARTSGAAVIWDVLISGGQLFYETSAGFTGCSTISTGTWYMWAVTKAGGSATVRDHLCVMSTNTWTHTDRGTMSDGTGTVDNLRISDGSGSNRYDGYVAAEGVWSSVLNDAAIEALRPGLSAWVSAGVIALWRLNDTPVDDLTGNGANQTLLDGTTVDLGVEPPNFDYNLAPPVVEGTATVDLGALTIGAVGKTIVKGSAGVSLGGLGVGATGTPRVNGAATVNLGAISTTAVGKRTAVGVATVNLGALTISGSSITGGPVILPDDFYSPGPCRPYDWVGFCVPIPTEAAAISGYAVQAASEILYFASGQRFDTCQVTLRPCRKECYGDGWNRLSAGWWDVGGGWGPWPALINGLWYNITCGSCGTDCSCSIVSETLLPGPVREIAQVTVDGVVLDPVTDYRLDDYRKLVRLGGDQWPLCNNLNLGITAEGTWSVTAIYGEPMPTLGKFAMGQLLCQIIADVLGDDCALPDNVTNVTRQGLSFTLDEVSELIKSGFTGLKYVDQFVQRYNPNNLAARPRLYDVDGPNSRVTGTSF